MGTWWRGTRLVAARGLVESIRSRSFKVVTGLLLLASVAAVTLPLILGGRATTYTLATLGRPSPQLVVALDAAGQTGGFAVRYATYTDIASVRQAVRDGKATAGLTAATLFTSTSAGGTFPALVAQGVVSVETSRQLTAAGLSPQQVADIQAVRPPAQVVVGQVDNQGRAATGFAVGVVLYLALTFAGSAIATTVAGEKATRISEVLLSVLRPSQVLAGTVLAVGAVTLVQLLVLASPLAVAVNVTDKIGLPPVASGDIALGGIWFILGFVIYAFLFAATASLVNKVTEVSTAILPVTMMLLGSYLLAITVVTSDPAGPWSVVLSLVPVTAPVAMPMRWSSGLVPGYQLLLAMALTAATAVALVFAASAMYRRALLITGRRVRLREIVRRPTAR